MWNLSRPQTDRDTIEKPYWCDIPIEHSFIDTSYSDTAAISITQESPAPPAPVTKIPQQNKYEVNRCYDEGYEAGYEAGLDDGCAKCREWQYDDSCPYRGKNRREYQLGYEEGYDDGYSDGYNDSGYDPAEED